MYRPLTALTTAVLMAASSSYAGAQATPSSEDGPSVTVGGVLFYDYTFAAAPETTDAAGAPIRANAFNVTRTYLNVTGRVNAIVGFRLTPDIVRHGTGSGVDGLTFRLKYGYAQFDLDRFTGPWSGTWVRAGMQQTPFIDGQESVYRYRFQGTVFAERDGRLSSSDTGVSARTNLPGGYGDVHAGLYNGEGYARPEINDQKAFMLRATVRPLPAGGPLARGLRVTAYVHRDHVMRDADRHRFIASAWYEHARLNAGFDYIARSDQSSPGAPAVASDGYSIFVTPFFRRKGDGLEALLRFDSFRRDRHLRSTRQQRTIAGLAWWMPAVAGRARAAILLDYEQVLQRGEAATTPPDRRVTLHGAIDF